jgi:hypothetical protein
MRRGSPQHGRFSALALTAILASFSTAIACSGGAGGAGVTPTPAGSACSAGRHRAYVVVEHRDRRTLQRCVGFDAEQIDGEALMQRSGIQYQVQQFSFGKGVCQIDNEPAQFSECFPKNAPNWSLFVATGGGQYTAATKSYDATTVNDGGTLGWRYLAADATPEPPPPPRISN